MIPLQHLILTTLAYFALESYFNLNISILIGSLIATIMLDVIDHSQSLLRTRKNFFRTLRKNGILKTYNDYLRKRNKEFKPIFHTPFWLLATILLALIFNNFIIWLGIVFHFFCDIINDYLTKKTTKS